MILVCDIIICMYKVKSKVFPVHAIKADRGNRGIAPLILNLGTRCR